jgi:hypothetical protein
MRSMAWHHKLIICILYDIFDFTIGRALFALPFSGEIVGCIFANLLFGSNGFLYGLEAIDVTEQIDGFIPTATFIAMKNRPTQSSSS